MNYHIIYLDKLHCERSTTGSYCNLFHSAEKWQRKICLISVLNLDDGPLWLRCKGRVCFGLSSFRYASRPLSITSSLVRCRRVFAALVALAVEELVEAADSLLAPVRLGVVRPTAPFPLANTYVDLVNGSEDLFGVEPLSTGHTRLSHSRRYVKIWRICWGSEKYTCDILIEILLLKIVQVTSNFSCR